MGNKGRSVPLVNLPACVTESQGFSQQDCHQTASRQFPMAIAQRVPSAWDLCDSLCNSRSLAIPQPTYILSVHPVTQWCTLARSNAKNTSVAHNSCQKYAAQSLNLLPVSRCSLLIFGIWSVQFYKVCKGSCEKLSEIQKHHFHSENCPTLHWTMPGNKWSAFLHQENLYLL